jgi:glycopeptide antibiotics resistance protein
MLRFNYLVITISLIIYVLILFAIRIKKRFSIEEFILYSGFYVYSCFVINKVFFPLPITDIGLFREINNSRPIIFNYIPFNFIIDIFEKSSSNHQLIRQVVGNVVLFGPYGFLVPLIFLKFDSFKKLIVLGIITSLSIELIQLITSLLMGFTYRIADIDDIICNTTGTLIGYCAYKASLPFLKRLVLLNKFSQ